MEAVWTRFVSCLNRVCPSVLNLYAVIPAPYRLCGSEGSLFRKVRQDPADVSGFPEHGGAPEGLTSRSIALPIFLSIWNPIVCRLKYGTLLGELLTRSNTIIERELTDRMVAPELGGGALLDLGPYPMVSGDMAKPPGIDW